MFPLGRSKSVGCLDPKRVDAIFVQRPFGPSIRRVRTKCAVRHVPMHAATGPRIHHVVDQSSLVIVLVQKKKKYNNKHKKENHTRKKREKRKKLNEYIASQMRINENKNQSY